MVLLEFSMSPFDKGESLSKYVARSLDIIDNAMISGVFFNRLLITAVNRETISSDTSSMNFGVASSNSST